MKSSFVNRPVTPGWMRSLLVIVSAAVLGVTVGCCKYEGCEECPTPRVVTHTVAIGEDLADCSTVGCVCSSPVKVAAVRGGDQLLFVNTTQHVVTVSPSDPSVLIPSHEIVIPPKGSGSYTFQVNHGYASGMGFGIDLEAAAPATTCTGLPGPSIEFD